MNEPLNNEPQNPELLHNDAVTVIPEKLPELTIEKEIAYVVTDKYFDDFHVQKSANAWWMDRTKVSSLINAFKGGYNIKGACIQAGITERQYKYFVELHPDFCTVKDTCEELSKMIIETGLMKHLQEANPTVLMWAAERRIPEKYGKHLAEGGGGQVFQNFGTIVNVKPETAARILELRKEQNGDKK